MRIAPLASGSRGNSLLLAAGDQQLLVDNGLPLEQLGDALTTVGVAPSDVTAVLMTHRHRDHARGVADFCRTFDTPVYGTRRTLRSLCNRLQRRLHTIPTDRSFRLGTLDVRAVKVRHDAPDTVAYRFDDGHHRFGLATDLGCADGAIAEVFVQLDALLLEFNYEPELLERGPYPAQLRARVASDTGHLSNQQAAALLQGLAHPGLRRVWVGHVSERNNRPELALAAARSVLPAGARTEVVLATQDLPSEPLLLGVRPTE
ncbi:MAG: MBL fold metallo-hydrolase [Planctomycetes bacterium]|nr:MBL fold metallo-hydrolase [Planctomycetota bacterium]MCB9868460.1 MBL fold metallo-hydrolase [Planctomycetota bacterium]